MNRAAFFASLRGAAMFPHGFTQQQMDGVTNLLSDPLNLLAYNLAAAFQEATGDERALCRRLARQAEVAAEIPKEIYTLLTLDDEIEQLDIRQREPMTRLAASNAGAAGAS
jgi:hypothetical protein